MEFRDQGPSRGPRDTGGWRSIGAISCGVVSSLRQTVHPSADGLECAQARVPACPPSVPDRALAQSSRLCELNPANDVAGLTRTHIFPNSLKVRSMHEPNHNCRIPHRQCEAAHLARFLRDCEIDPNDDLSFTEGMDAVTTFRRNFERLSAQKKLTRADVARRGGLPYSTLKGALESESAPRLDTVEKVAKGLGVSLDELMTGASKPTDWGLLHRIGSLIFEGSPLEGGDVAVRLRLLELSYEAAQRRGYSQDDDEELSALTDVAVAQLRAGPRGQ